MPKDWFKELNADSTSSEESTSAVSSHNPVVPPQDSPPVEFAQPGGTIILDEAREDGDKPRGLTLAYSAPEDQVSADVVDFPETSLDGDRELQMLLGAFKTMYPNSEEESALPPRASTSAENPTVVSQPGDHSIPTPPDHHHKRSIEIGATAGAVVVGAALLVGIGWGISSLAANDKHAQSDTTQAISTTPQSAQSAPSSPSPYGRPICNTNGDNQKTLIDTILSFQYAYYTLQDASFIPSLWPTANMTALASAISSYPANTKWCVTFSRINGTSVRMELSDSVGNAQNKPPYLTKVTGRKTGNKWIITSFESI